MKLSEIFDLITEENDETQQYKFDVQYVGGKIVLARLENGKDIRGTFNGIDSLTTDSFNNQLQLKFSNNTVLKIKQTVALMIKKYKDKLHEISGYDDFKVVVYSNGATKIFILNPLEKEKSKVPYQTGVLKSFLIEVEYNNAKKRLFLKMKRKNSQTGVFDYVTGEFIYDYDANSLIPMDEFNSKMKMNVTSPALMKAINNEIRNLIKKYPAKTKKLTGIPDIKITLKDKKFIVSPTNPEEKE